MIKRLSHSPVHMLWVVATPTAAVSTVLGHSPQLLSRTSTSNFCLMKSESHSHQVFGNFVDS